MDPAHAKQRLLFYISDAIDDSHDIADMKKVIEEVAVMREWVIAPPDFVDESEINDEAGPLRTVGGCLEMYSALPPWGDALPPEIDRAHLDEVKTIIHAVAAFSKRTGHEIAFELDGSQIGWIENGIVDNSLREGLLEEWEKTLK